jgi:uncharacterized protein YndB with AHSA1/START domain
VDPFSLETTVARPRGEVFEYLMDVANHPEFTDHFLKDWRMTREETFGLGAGGRFRAELPFARFPWGDLTIVEVDPGRKVVLAGRMGKFNRIRTLVLLELADAATGTRVETTVRTFPQMPSDRFLEALGQRRAMKRGWRRALKRLRAILEEDRDRGVRATIAGGPRKPATGLRV